MLIQRGKWPPPLALSGRVPACHPERYARILLADEGRSTDRHFTVNFTANLLPQVRELDFRSIIRVLNSPGTGTGR